MTYKKLFETHMFSRAAEEYTSLLPDLYIGTCLVIYNENKYLSYVTVVFPSASQRMR